MTAAAPTLRRRLDTPTIDLETAGRLAVEPVVPELVTPLSVRAAAALDDECSTWATPVDHPPLDAGLRRDLLDWHRQGVSRLSNLVVLQRFAGFQLVRDPFWRPRAAAPGDAPAGSSRAGLDAYIAWERGEGLLSPRPSAEGSDDRPYPELSRLLDAWHDAWLRGCRRLVERFDRHRAAITDLVAAPPGSKVTLRRARFGISDPHDGGQTAAILELTADGLAVGRAVGRVVYKPRSVDGEALWGELSRRVLEPALGLPIEAPWVIRGDDDAGRYGFVEFVEHDPLPSIADDPLGNDSEAADRAFTRYGGMLALAHALGTVDLHHENVIVRDEQPLVVDGEPLVRPRLDLSSQGAERLRFERNLSLEGIDARPSILELGLLPMTMRVPLPDDPSDDPSVDSNGHGTAREVTVGALHPYGREPLVDTVACGRGSDQLQLRPVDVIARSFPSLPHRTAGASDGTPCLPSDHLDALERGFERAHRWLETRGPDLLDDPELAPRLAAARVRFLARPTMDYATVLTRSLAPEVLRSADARRRQIRDDLETLGELRFDAVGELVDDEVEALFEGDIPRFEVTADAPGCGRAPFAESGRQAAHARLTGLDAADRRLQRTIVRERLRARERDLAASLPRGVDPESLERRALALVDALARAAVDDGTDAPSWTTSTYAPGFGATMAHADRESLYEGAVGVAIVLAEAARFGDPAWRDLATHVVEPIGGSSDLPLVSPSLVSPSRGAGLARGLGGLLYALVRLADATGDDRWLERARSIALTHGPAFARGPGLDEVLNGRAGLLLALQALVRRRPSRRGSRHQARRLDALCDTVADGLLRRAVRDPSTGGARWSADGAVDMANLSHGAAGIAMALARDAARRDHAESAETALAALRTDDGFWLPDERGWRDVRLASMDRAGGDRSDAPRTSWSWCNGRSGALLARHAVGEALGVEVLGPSRDALGADASDALLECSPGLCCGTAGVVDGLGVLPATEAVRGARDRAVRLLAEATTPSLFSTLSPSLFTGTAGLAFALLRAARPDEVRSIVTFD